MDVSIPDTISLPLKNSLANNSKSSHRRFANWGKPFAFVSAAILLVLLILGVGGFCYVVIPKKVRISAIVHNSSRVIVNQLDFSPNHETFSSLLTGPIAVKYLRALHDQNRIAYFARYNTQCYVEVYSWNAAGEPLGKLIIMGRPVRFEPVLDRDGDGVKVLDAGEFVQEVKGFDWEKIYLFQR